MRAQFVEACGAAGDDRLTDARCRALQRFVGMFEHAERKPVAVSECLEPVRQALFVAALSGRVFDPAPELSLTDDEAAALACLV